MIANNGFIQVKTVSGGGIGEDGNPIQATGTWSEKIPCLIQTNNYSNKGKYQDGKFIMSSYTIFINDKGFSAHRIKVFVNGAESEFDVQSVQILSLVGKVKVTV